MACAETMIRGLGQNPSPLQLKELFKTVKTNEEEKLMKAPSGKSQSFVAVGPEGLVLPHNRYDEVYPGIILGDKNLAIDISMLKANGITHVLNTAQGSKFTQIETDQAFYGPSGIKFHGFSAMDNQKCSLEGFFEDCAEFVHSALESNGRVYIHCFQGMSRSATITIVFLMLKRGMNVVEASTTIRKKRPILPNDGFLRQLCDLNNKLYPPS